ncbi:MAG: sigma-70 family RNA polymerase sigma factor [Acidobacteria bacterium]|nr:sigma-70 family RNA polymerase sigma factor [Acidobacteriota bacterium]MCA1641045.1 sigma-70 family RNA polymerase sigma factor [Acidobacteriota bacterium]
MSAEIAHLFMTGAHDAPQRTRGEERADPLAALVARARAGDSLAFERIMLATEQRVVSVAWRLLGNREDARDAAQEVYLRVFKYLDRFRAGEDFQGWLYRITVNVCHDLARKRRAGAVGQLDDLDPDRGRAAFESPRGGADAEGETLRAQQLALVRRALATLPEKERAALVLRDLEGLSTEETARALGSRPVTVRSQVSTARSKIKIYCDRLLAKGGGAR